MKARKRKNITGAVRASGSPREGKAQGGYPHRMHQDTVPAMGQGPQGDCKAIIPWGDAPAVPKPPVGAGKGFRGI